MKLPKFHSIHSCNIHTSKSFTLIELLVVIAIIALLSSIVLASLNTARQKSRIAMRLADLHDVQLALEMYASDNGGSYPATSVSYGIWRSQCSNWGGYAPADVIPGLTPVYMSSIPADPSMNAPSSVNCYLYASDGINYKFLEYNLQDMSLSNIQSHFSVKDPPRGYDSGQCWNGDIKLSMSVYSSGGSVCW